MLNFLTFTVSPFLILHAKKKWCIYLGSEELYQSLNGCLSSYLSFLDLLFHFTCFWRWNRYWWPFMTVFCDLCILDWISIPLCGFCWAFFSQYIQMLLFIGSFARLSSFKRLLFLKSVESHYELLCPSFLVLINRWAYNFMSVFVFWIDRKWACWSSSCSCVKNAASTAWITCWKVGGML